MNTETKYARAKWAEKLGVSTSGYYTWLHGRKRRRVADDARREKVIAVFNEGQGVYGVDRICGILRRDGNSASYPVVKRIMSQEGLKSSHCRRRQRSLTDSRKSRGDEYKNLTKGLEITRPFQALSSDISYIRTGEGFDYLCQIRDVCSNTVLASCQAENMKKELVLKTLKAAQHRWHLPADVIFHSDRGSQYTAAEVMEQIAAYGWKQSFSAVGKPGDNAWSESFFSILKKEIVHWRFYPTREAARQAIFEYIEVFYNRLRVQKRLGYLSPIQFLNAWNKRALPCSA
ncbi:MAG TPA: IS3 family transposase [Clostridiales bacterium]|nr:IS3 family transposase [Clostridiales bacterium]